MRPQVVNRSQRQLILNYVLQLCDENLWLLMIFKFSRFARVARACLKSGVATLAVSTFAVRHLQPHFCSYAECSFSLLQFDIFAVLTFAARTKAVEYNSSCTIAVSHNCSWPHMQLLHVLFNTFAVEVPHLQFHICSWGTTSAVPHLQFRYINI